MKAELSTGNHLQSLTIFSESDLASAIWEHDKEFFLGKEKFDVVKTVLVDGVKTFYCINDSEEIELLKALQKQSKDDKTFENVIKKFQVVHSAWLAVIIPQSSGTIQHRAWMNIYSYTSVTQRLKPPIFIS